MSNITTYKHADNLPAFLRTFAVSTELMAGGTGFSVISIKGKVFHIVTGESKELVTLPDNPEQPAGSIDAVIIKANPGTSKVFYADGYTEGSADKPTCYSNDGIAPAADAAEAQCSKCAACPHNAWGSRVSESGGKGKACADVKRIAVSMVHDLKNPMLLRVPAASLKALTQYADKLVRTGAPYQALITRIGFDYTVAHPQLTFKPVRFITEEEFGDINEVMHGPTIGQITGETPSAPAQDAQAKPTAATAPAPAPKPKAEPKPEPKPEPAAAAPAAAALFEQDEAPAAAPAPEPKPEPKPRAAAKPKAAPVEAPATVASGSMADELNDMLKGMGFDD